MIVNLETLRKLASDKGKSMMMLGKAAEHIVCAHLIMNGYVAYLSEQALPYDAIVDTGDLLLRLQVKGSAFPVNINPRGPIPSYRYLFDLKKCGKDARRTRSRTEYDIAAMVALDTCEIAYLPSAAIGVSVKGTFSVTNQPESTVLSRGRRFEDYSFEKALLAVRSGDIKPLQSQRGGLVEFGGESHTRAEWSKLTGIPQSCLDRRFAEGWSPERALNTPRDLTRIRKMQPLLSQEELAHRSEAKSQWWAEKRKKLIQEDQDPLGRSGLDPKRSST